MTMEEGLATQWGARSAGKTGTLRRSTRPIHSLEGPGEEGTMLGFPFTMHRDTEIQH
jgi:hypothetical protein